MMWHLRDFVDNISPHTMMLATTACMGAKAMIIQSCFFRTMTNLQCPPRLLLLMLPLLLRRL